MLSFCCLNHPVHDTLFWQAWQKYTFSHPFLFLSTVPEGQARCEEQAPSGCPTGGGDLGLPDSAHTHTQNKTRYTVKSEFQINKKYTFSV